eukprot:9664930-Ditylum_brightwellii.AAC.1
MKREELDIKISQIKAHQDDKNPVNELTLEARLNMMTDTNVNAFRFYTPPHLESLSTPPEFPSSKVHMMINGCITTGSAQQCLQDNYNGTNIAAYIQKGNGLKMADIDLID